MAWKFVFIPCDLLIFRKRNGSGNVAHSISRAEQAATAVLDWNTLSATNQTTTIGPVQYGIQAIWFLARTRRQIPVELLVLDPQNTATYYQQANIDPRHNCHGETFGPLHPNGRRYNIYEGNVQDILDEGFSQVGSRDLLAAGDVAIWFEPNRTAAHSARVEIVVQVGGRIDRAKTLLWTKNGLSFAQIMPLEDVDDLYKLSLASGGGLQPTTLEFWRASAIIQQAVP